MMEWIAGEVVRARINEWIAERKKEGGRGSRKRAREEEGMAVIREDEKAEVEEDAVEVAKGVIEAEDNSELVNLLGRIGTAVGKLHAVGVVHGDLTTSNLMLRPWLSELSNGEASNDDTADQGGRLEGEVILIDFGLASQSSADEDRAVDLYVLERAFGSTHPSAEGLFGEVLKAYGKSFNGAKVVLKRLEDVRMRGRKRSMIG